MINFYDIDLNYISFLQKYDSKVPNIQYHGNNKFVCGIVLHINGINYYAPISSNKTKQQTNMIITDSKGNAISSIKFSFMIPAKFNCLTKKNFSDIKNSNYKYYRLILEEYKFCKKQENKIHEKALKIYNASCNPNHFLHNVCCDFQKLEKVYQLYGSPLDICYTT